VGNGHAVAASTLAPRSPRSLPPAPPSRRLADDKLRSDTHRQRQTVKRAGPASEAAQPRRPRHVDARMEPR
jgi:hypothetical protein